MALDRLRSWQHVELFGFLGDVAIVQSASHRTACTVVDWLIEAVFRTLGCGGLCRSAGPGRDLGLRHQLFRGRF